MYQGMKYESDKGKSLHGTAFLREETGGCTSLLQLEMLIVL